MAPQREGQEGVGRRRAVFEEVEVVFLKFEVEDGALGDILQQRWEP